MIEAGLEFRAGTLDTVISAFLSLPVELKPRYFASEEKDVGGRATSVENQKKFVDFMRKNEAGFFLRAPGITYSIRRGFSRIIICDCFLETKTPTIIKNFFFTMAQANPVFGFACASEERLWRNRITVKIGVNTIESWVGRNTAKYIPGLYWLTLIPEQLVKLHNVPFDEITKAAEEKLLINGDQCLLRFFKNPDEWQVHRNKLDALCASVPGIFSAEKIRTAAMSATSYIELSEMLAECK
jgi:hypothetical protein